MLTTTDGPAPRPLQPAAQSFTSGAKDMITTSLSSRVWATIGDGILNEIYWPAIDQPQTKDFGFLVAGDGWWREVKRMGRYFVANPSPAVPLPRITHSAAEYRLTLTILPDPDRDALLIDYQLEGEAVRLYPLIAPHMGVYGSGSDATGDDNEAWIDADNAVLFAGHRMTRFVALAAAPAFVRASVGYVGDSDGWQDFARHGHMTWHFDHAGPGTVALMGELTANQGRLALAFAGNQSDALATAQAAARADFGQSAAKFSAQWSNWSATLTLPTPDETISAEAVDALRQSATVLRAHEDRERPGAFVAGLAVPWGNFTNDPGGYHLCWCRDGVETGFALAACGEYGAGGRMLAFLLSRQNPDGSWPRCFFIDGSPLQGIQLDEAAFPVLLASKLSELGAALPDGVGPMVTKALSFLAANGPTSATFVDRWEETPGASPFTIAVQIAALVGGSPWLSVQDRDYAVSLADCWNERTEEWTTVPAGEVDCFFNTGGHYVRIGPNADTIKVGNQPIGPEVVPADRLIGLDFLYLVRLGLREPLDELIVDTVKIADAMISRDTPSGRSFYRYNLDGYGEWTDGVGWAARKFGIGRPWPLLAGERGHYEVLAGGNASGYLQAMLGMRGHGNLISEQIWDANPIPWYKLEIGRPTGSAMPLAWAHSELIKLAFTMRSGAPVEMLAAVKRRYPAAKRPEASTWYWQDVAPVRALPRGRSLVVQDRRQFTLHVGFDNWTDVFDREAERLGLGMYGVRLDKAELQAHSSVQFVRHYGDGWEPAKLHNVTLDKGAISSRSLTHRDRDWRAATGRSAARRA